MGKQVADRKAILQAFWRKAYRDGQAAIPCPDVNTAKKIRLDLYNAVKQVKKDMTLDPELHTAVKHCVISFATPTIVLVKRAEAEMMLVEAALIAGIDVSAVQAAPTNRAELEEKESAARLNQKLAGHINQGGSVAETPVPAYQRNRFYTRDGG